MGLLVGFDGFQNLGAKFDQLQRFRNQFPKVCVGNRKKQVAIHGGA